MMLRLAALGHAALLVSAEVDLENVAVGARGYSHGSVTPINPSLNESIPLVGAPRGATCNATAAYCFANARNHIVSLTTNATECCAACLANPKCASYSHWGGKTTAGSAHCFLFSTVDGQTEGPTSHCTAGTSGRAPSPAPPPRPPTPPAPPPSPSGKNFVLFLTESVRAESLGTYGHPITRTPAFDRLAKEGTIFQQAHTLSTSSPTSSRVTMATGRYVHTKNHRTTQHLVQSWESNLFGLLKEQGYYVAFFGKNYLLSEESLSSVDFWAPEASPSNMTVVLNFLANPPQQPFIMLVSAPGASYDSSSDGGGTQPAFGQPGYYSYYNNGTSVYDPKQIEADAPLRPVQPAVHKKPGYHKKIRSYRNLESLAAPGSDFFYRLNAAYLQSVTQDVDAVLGKVLDALAKNAQLDAKTCIIATAESGDYAGDYGLVKTWPGGLDDVLTRVPLVARIPGGAKGHVVSEQVQLFDVMPTVLELSQKIPRPTKNTHFARSLVKQLMGAKGDPSRIVYAEAGFLFPSELEPLHSGGPSMVNASDPWSMEYPRRQQELQGCSKNVTLQQPNYKGCLGSPRATMARSLTHKLVYRADGDISELYDLTNDPKELVNVYDTPTVAAVQKRLLGEMLQWYQETSDTTDWQVKTGRGAPKMGTDGYPVTPRLPKGGRAPGDKRPNFVFYFPDTVAAESCGGLYGNPVVKTPFMDALAAEGTLFKQAHVLHTQCAPSRHAIVTGRYMHTTGHRTQSHGVEEWEPDIFKYLHDAGYYINWFGKDDALGPNAFKYIDYWEGMTENHMLEFLSQNTKEPFFMFIPTIGAHPAYRGSGDPENIDRSGPCFQEGDPGYFSMYNNCSASIYDWRDVREKAPLRPPINPRNHSYPMYRREDGIVHYHDLDREPLATEDEAFWYRLNAVYLDMVHRVDQELGDLLAAIDNNTNAPGLKDRTAFFVSSDHGDFAGNHHLVEKWPGAVDDLLTHVPFVARMPSPEYLPNGLVGAKGHVVEEQIQVFDIMPTALELAGIVPNRTHFATSLVPQLMGGRGDPNRTVYSDGGFFYPTEIEPIAGDCDLRDDFYGKRGLEEILNFSSVNPSAPTSKPFGCNRSHWDDPNWTGCLGSPRAVMAKTLEYKLVFRPREVSEFYDVKSDPRMLENLWGRPEVADVQQQMLDGLLKWYLETTDVTPLAEDDVGYPTNHSSGPPDEELWWQKFNPHLHTQYQTMTVDGHPLEGEH